jgi:radical SAM superfamily enzyme
VVSFLERLNPEIVIQRLSGEAPLQVLIAPKWGKRYPEIVQDIDTEMEKRDTWQGKLFEKSVRNERLTTV